MTRKRKTSGLGHASWLETYSDMVTLLLTFFIMLYAMSTIDAQKYSLIVQALSKGDAIVTQDDLPIDDDLLDEGSIEETPIIEEEDTDDIDKLYTLLMEYISKNNLNDSVEVSKTEEYVFIRFYDDITFNGYSNQLKISGKAILDVLAEGLGSVDNYIEEVIIAGHTAEVERDKSTIDRTLSTERANAVLQHLEAKNVINPAKYLAIGYGLYSPIADNNTPEGRAKNRRVEIYISRKGHPISYTNIIKDTLNGIENSDVDSSVSNNIVNKQSLDYKNKVNLE
ncbi:chemotaxis protein MotB [Sedimentibacter acidaminivorans]|uniref:Chemotaxis protein MotB n=1 Tax=Sedimentibacter acidaminivorans TaxID=913099 RepID=A0ABS4GDJ2_9FIRM|nr:flagellar motor protein MotB [Sedimentibacter acidaminivorans]MBP1925744.1 chemotaxis protein MotB [Sedimentibacter acidaminivorans]